MITAPAIGTSAFFASLILAALVLEPDVETKTLSVRPTNIFFEQVLELAADSAFVGMCVAMAVTAALSRMFSRTSASVSAKEMWYLLNGGIIHLLMVRRLTDPVTFRRILYSRQTHTNTPAPRTE